MPFRLTGVEGKDGEESIYRQENESGGDERNGHGTTSGPMYYSVQGAWGRMFSYRDTVVVQPLVCLLSYAD